MAGEPTANSAQSLRYNKFVVVVVVIVLFPQFAVLVRFKGKRNSL